VKLSVSKNNQVLNEIDLGQEISGIEKGSTTFFVGRSSQCQIHLDDRQISREHAQIVYQSGEWILKKTSEFSTLKVNGSEIDTYPLKDGDTISIPPFSLTASIEKTAEDIVTETIDQPLESETSIPEQTDPDIIDHSEESDIGLSESAGEVQEEQELDLSGEGGEEGSRDLDDSFGDSFGSEAGSTDDSFSGEGDDSFGSDDAGDGFGDVDENFGETSGGNEFADDYNEEYSDDYGDEEGGFGDGSYDVDTLDDDDGDKTQVLQSFASTELEIFGEHAPYDKFVVEKPETLIGRDPEKCDIVLSDPEVSSIHAVIKKNAITCTLEDQKSANGTLLNGQRINSHELTNGDEFLIGSTTFTVKIKSSFLEQEEERLMPVEENQVVEVEEVVEVDENFDDSEIIELGEGEEGVQLGKSSASESKSLFSKDALKDPEKRKKLLIGAVILLGLWTLLEEPEKPKQKTVVKKKMPKKNSDKVKGKNKKPLTKEQIVQLEQRYLLAQSLLGDEKYSRGLIELEKIAAIAPDYKETRALLLMTKEALEKLEKEEKRIREEKARIERVKKVKGLVEKARSAVKERKVILAKGLFTQIASLDPENFELTQLKLELEDYEKKLEQERLEEERKKEARKQQELALEPGKNFYLKKEWYNAIIKLGDFLRREGIDDDLKTEASDMLNDSKKKLDQTVEPLIGKARSLKEGQDLKGAYEHYMEVLRVNIAHEEALNQMNEIREKLELRSKKVYREAIIAESLSLFDNAKEKFQEVQQISPTDSEYYQKATDKLKEYIE
jgi:pSer/pThr/pTyr-binding forkhead associated (FHA) protein